MSTTQQTILTLGGHGKSLDGDPLYLLQVSFFTSQDLETTDSYSKF